MSKTKGPIGLAKIDAFGVKPVERLHFAKQDSHQTAIGGVCTLLMLVVFLVIFFLQAYPIYKKRNPNFSTKREKISPDEVIRLKDISSFLHFTLYDGIRFFEIDETKLDI